jgi:hypothetical protein
MTNKFLSKGTPVRPEPGPPASTDHFLPDEGIPSIAVGALERRPIKGQLLVDAGIDFRAS